MSKAVKADGARAESVRRLAESHAGDRGPLLPALHAILEEFGYVDDDDIAVLADVFNLTNADVHGVVSFYHDFRRTPPPAHRVVLCRAEACQANGAEDVFTATRTRFADRDDVEVGEVFCLGNCALGPSGMIDGRLHARLDADTIGLLLERKAGR